MLAVPAGSAEFDPSYRYVINLESNQRAVSDFARPELETLSRFTLYTTRFVKDGAVWNRLRLGFFPTKEAAEEVLASLLRPPRIGFPGHRESTR